MILLYQSNSFYINSQNENDFFYPELINIFKIFTDKDYFHYCDDAEKTIYPQNTIAFIRVTGGSGKIYLTDNSIVLNENDCIFLKFQDIKEYKSLSGIWEYSWTNFTCNAFKIPFKLNKTYTFSYSENEKYALDKLLHVGQGDIINTGYINALFLNYFYTIFIESNLDKQATLCDSGKKLIDEMCAFIQQKIYSKITIEEISLFFKITPRRLHQIFTKELNISPKQYILKKKMEEGYRLLVQTAIPINKIAYMLCFSSPYHFTNEFKKVFNQSPSQVRKMEKEYAKI